MIQPRIMAGKALCDVVNLYVGKESTEDLCAKIKDETLALLKERGIDLIAHASEIEVSFIRPDLPNMIIPDELLAGIQIH